MDLNKMGLTPMSNLEIQTTEGGSWDWLESGLNVLDNLLGLDIALVAGGLTRRIHNVMHNGIHNVTNAK